MQLVKITENDIAGMDARGRAKFINSVVGYKSANLIGTVDSDGNENLAIVSSVIHLGSSPALVAFISRPHSVERHSLENIINTGYYTINAVSNDITQQAHQTSARYEKHQSEFAMVGLNTEYDHDFFAPFVAESQLKLGMKLVERVTINSNQTEMVIGEIERIWVARTAVMPDGYIDIESLGIVAISGLDSYHSTSRLHRLSYAKPSQLVYPLTIEGEPSSWQALVKQQEEKREP
ncbi:flavin reductase family protein [Vibrio taketomensis]|uniref:flavin reductase family protein n=1 Tax=Vibrio taketomensis TaxID=2572923 RepID=UPI001389C3D0|nr:flavin reductase [Vibrio taketomensis]